MMLKWLKHGTGLASRAVDYVLADHDHKGNPRPRIEVLRGDPQRVADLADSLDFKHRYQSGVLSWAKEDAPTIEQINAVVEDIERAMLAGLGPDADPSRLAFFVVLHDTDLHILVARVDLATGKSYAVAPPGWQKLYDPIRDMHNHRHGWARPDDPLRARPVQPGHEAFVEAASIRTALREKKEREGKDSLKMTVTDWVLQRIHAGLIVDRKGVRDCLADLGEIKRENAAGISVKLEGESSAIRLRGGIYAADFNGPAWLERPPPSREPNPEAEEAARKAFEKALKWRADRDAGRYRVPEPAPVPTPAVRSRRDVEPERKRDARPPNDVSAPAVPVASPGEPPFDLEWLNEPIDVPESEDLESGWQRVNEWIRGAYERIREDLARRFISTRFRATVEAIRDGHDATRRSDLALAAAGADVQRAAERTHQALRDSGAAFERGIQRLRDRLAAKLVADDSDDSGDDVDLDKAMNQQSDSPRPAGRKPDPSGPGM